VINFEQFSSLRRHRLFGAGPEAADRQRVCDDAADVPLAQKALKMKFVQRLNEQPSSWFLLFGTVAIVGYLLYLVGDGMTW